MDITIHYTCKECSNVLDHIQFITFNKFPISLKNSYQSKRKEFQFILK